MVHTSSKNIVLWVILVFIIIVSVVGVTFSLFIYSKTSINVPSITTGNATLGYVEESNGIFLSNALPISDINALNTKDANNYFDFYVIYDFPEDTKVSYEIDIENITSEMDEVKNNIYSSLDNSRIKVALEDRTSTLPDDPMVVSPTYFSMIDDIDASNSKNGYFLYSKTASGKATHYYRLYMWIPEVDDAGVAIPLVDMDDISGIRNQVFSVKIDVQATVSVQ